MTETTDSTSQIVTDEDTLWLVDSDGNTYSYRLTEAERLQDSAHSSGFIPDDLMAVVRDAEKGGNDEYLADLGELSGADETGDPVPDHAMPGDGETSGIVTDEDTIWSVDSDGNTWSYRLTEAERLQDSAHSTGYIPDDLPADIRDAEKGGNDEYLADLGELSGADETGNPVPDQAAPVSGLGDGDMIMDAVMEAYSSFDLIF